MIFAKSIKTFVLSLLFASFVTNIRAQDDNTTSTHLTISDKAPTQYYLEPSFYIKQIFSTFLIRDYLKDSKLPDVTLNPIQTLTKYGYTTETYEVITKDEYILTLFRITGSPASPAKFGKPVVFLQHGVLTCSADWTLSGPEEAFAFLLADAGYDVWLGNARGTTYSRAHVKISPSEKEFWDFSFHEIGIYDLPAQIDRVLEVSGQEKIIYMGHSMGTTVVFILLSEIPEYNDKFHALFIYAPVVYINFKSFLISAGLPLVSTLVNKYVDIFGSFEVGRQLSFLTRFIVNSCLAATPLQILCANLYFSAFGYDISNINKTNVPTIAYNYPAGTSLKTLVHYSQLHAFQDFQMYDYKKNNIEHYGQDKPPKYKLSNTKVPVHIFYGHNDWLCSFGKDLDKIKKEISGKVTLYVIRYKPFTHIDFTYAMNAKEFVYIPSIKLLNDYSKDNGTLPN